MKAKWKNFSQEKKFQMLSAEWRKNGATHLSPGDFY